MSAKRSRATSQRTGGAGGALTSLLDPGALLASESLDSISGKQADLYEHTAGHQLGAGLGSLGATGYEGGSTPGGAAAGTPGSTAAGSKTTSRGRWNPEEDDLLREAVQKYGGRNIFFIAAR